MKSLGRKALPVKESLDWEPMGSITISHATVKRLYDRSSLITIKMFWPLNHELQSINARISFNHKQQDLMYVNDIAFF